MRKLNADSCSVHVLVCVNERPEGERHERPRRDRNERPDRTEQNRRQREQDDDGTVGFGSDMPAFMKVAGKV